MKAGLFQFPPVPIAASAPSLAWRLTTQSSSASNRDLHNPARDSEFMYGWNAAAIPENAVNLSWYLVKRLGEKSSTSCSHFCVIWPEVHSASTTSDTKSCVVRACWLS